MAAGTALGWLALRILRSQVSELERSPLWLFPAAGLALVVIMMIAGYLPARRAASVDPMQSLRAE
jgi:macrolide transport system ATP-binding/permease protein